MGVEQIILGHTLHQLVFDFHHVLAGGDAGAIADAALSAWTTRDEALLTKAAGFTRLTSTRGQRWEGAAAALLTQAPANVHQTIAALQAR